jgi:uncharacterized protein YjiS (DUF1127 family)
MLKALINAYRKHAIYRQTYKELASLTNYELKDLGIHRSQIEEFAREAAYGKEEPINPFKNFFRAKTEKHRIEEYLAESANTVDLENRLRNIERGLAPWQIRARTFAQSWGH